MITVTSLTHPTMVAKIRQGLKYAALKQGDKMGGHANRVYVSNSKGHNIMRIDWLGKGQFIVYGGCDWGQTVVTNIVKEALRRSNVKPRKFNPTPCTKLYKGIISITLAVACMLGNPSDLASYMPNPQAMHQACAKAPQMLICEKMSVKL